MKPNKTQELDEHISELTERCKLESWNSFVEAIELPQDIAIALMTGRSELLRLAQPRQLTADEAAKLYKALAILIETNIALREHTQQTAQMVDNWSGMFAGLHGVGERIQRFANFDRKVRE